MEKRRTKKQILGRFNMDDTKSKNVPFSGDGNLKRLVYPQDEDDGYQDEFTYRELIGCLLYLGACTRPDISHAVSILASYVSCPRACYWEDLKGVF